MLLFVLLLLLLLLHAKVEMGFVVLVICRHVTKSAFSRLTVVVVVVVVVTTGPKHGPVIPRLLLFFSFLVRFLFIEIVLFFALKVVASLSVFTPFPVIVIILRVHPSTTHTVASYPGRRRRTPTSALLLLLHISIDPSPMIVVAQFEFFKPSAGTVQAGF
jgi:hypothetical protein